jgi:hypothetical protein
VPPPEKALAFLARARRAAPWRARGPWAIIGAPEKVRDGIARARARLRRRRGVVVTITSTTTPRRRSYELIAEAARPARGA